MNSCGKCDINQQVHYYKRYQNNILFQTPIKGHPNMAVYTIPSINFITSTPYFLPPYLFYLVAFESIGGDFVNSKR